MKKGAVIPSRADGEGPPNWKLRHTLNRVTCIAGARSLAVCAARDDTRFLPSLTSPSRI
jgi:hypothetical protein